MTRQAIRKRPVDPIAGQLEAVKRLLMLQLLKAGVSASDIAKVLGVAKSRISETIPLRSLSSVTRTDA